MKNKIITVLLLTQFAVPGFSQTSTMDTAGIRVELKTELTINIGSYHLSQNHVMQATKNEPIYFSEERKVMLGFTIGQPATQEGIPGTQNVPDPFDLIRQAYTTSERLERALQSADLAREEDQIRVLREAAKSIVLSSGGSETERPVRMALNRAVDTADNVYRIIGDNTEYARNLLIRFYRANFEFALASANEHSKMIYVGQTEQNPNVRITPIAEFGRRYNLLMRKFTAGLTTDQATAVILMKSMGYFGWDLNLDLARTSFKNLIADIYFLQTTNPSYLRVLRSLEMKQPPASQDVADLSAAISQIEDRIIPAFDRTYPGLHMAR